MSDLNGDVGGGCASGPIIGGQEREDRKADDNYERAKVLPFVMPVKPDPICPACSAPVDWSRIDRAWFSFEIGSVNAHICQRGMP